jgi:hypothetical protein
VAEALTVAKVHALLYLPNRCIVMTPDPVTTTSLFALANEAEVAAPVSAPKAHAARNLPTVVCHGIVQ